METKIIPISEVKSLLEQGLKISVKTTESRFVPIKRYVEKGFLDTYKITLTNGRTIKTSAPHRCFASTGWVETRHLQPQRTSLLCEDGLYSVVVSVEAIGKCPIVDIEVDDPDHCYFGNGILNHNTGKSAVAAGIMANAQKKGLRVALLDSEGTSTPQFMSHFGVDPSKVVRLQLQTIEDVFRSIEFICKKKIEEGGADWLIVWDSVASTPSKEELEADIEKSSIALMARALSKG
ncbi:MAG: hypothetical protein EOM67_15550, partial [Spirochaetia bacterium]|nr:hypothetical protein [Spirochaetia bacterium]